MLIAQITDMHIAEEGARMRRFVDANAKLARAVDYLSTRRVRPDIVIASGDLVNDGTPQEYMLLRELLDPLDIPLYLIPGNHDDREHFRHTFADRPWMPASGPIDYVVEGHDVRLVALDTTVDGRHDGEVGADQLQWLDESLSAAPSTPTLIFLHHPPFDTGLWLMDAMGLTGRDGLRAVVGRHPQVSQIVAGHVHRAITGHWGSTVLSTAPSTAHQTRCDLHPDEGAGANDEPSMLQLHLWTGDSFVTHTTVFEAPSKTIEFSTVLKNWDQARARILAGPPFPKGRGGLF